MSPARKWLRIVKYFLLAAIAVPAVWLLVQPFVEAKPNSQWRLARFCARINGAMYAAEVREAVSQEPYWLIQDVEIGVARAEIPDDPSHSIPPGIWPLRMEAASGTQRVRLVEALTDKVVLDEADVEWLVPLGRGPHTVSPVAWRGNRLLLWAPGSITSRPAWRKTEDDIVTIGRQYYFGVYQWLAYKVLGITVGAALLVVVCAWLADRWLAGLAQGRCEKCGYDLRGSVSGRCPECGAEPAV